MTHIPSTRCLYETKTTRFCLKAVVTSPWEYNVPTLIFCNFPLSYPKAMRLWLGTMIMTFINYILAQLKWRTIHSCCFRVHYNSCRRNRCIPTFFSTCQWQIKHRDNEYMWMGYGVTDMKQIYDLSPFRQG